MNSRFDQAAEQILNEHVVEEGLWDITKGVSRLLSPIASTALGFTPTGIATGIGAVKNTARGIANVYQGKKWDAEPDPKEIKRNTNKQPTVLKDLNVSSSDISNVTRQLATTAAEQTAMKPKLTSMFPMRGYVTAVEAAHMWTAVSEAAKKTQPGAFYKDIATNPSLKSAFVTKLDQELRTAGIDGRDITKLKLSVPDFLATISSGIDNNTVDARINNLL